MAERPSTFFYISGFFVGLVFLGLCLSFSILAYVKTTDKEKSCSPDCISDTCIQRQCLNQKCEVTWISPDCCFSLEQCLECNPFSDSDPKYYMDTVYTDFISNTNCTSSIYVQDSILTNNNLIVECINTYPDTQCTSEFGVMTLNGTILANYIEKNNGTFLNINNFLVSKNVSYFNTTSALAKLSNLTINGTVFVDYVTSCFNDSVYINGARFYPNGTLSVPVAHVQTFDITNMSSLTVAADVNVQGVLIRDGTVSGFANNAYSNLLVNPSGQNVGFGYTQALHQLHQKVNVNGTIGTTGFLFYPNNCTRDIDCTIDNINDWEGYANVTGITGVTRLDLRFFRLGNTVHMRVGNLSANATGNVQATAVLTNSTGPVALNVTNFLNPTSVVTADIVVTFTGLNIAIYAIASIDTLGFLRIQFDPYYNFSTDLFRMSPFTMTWML